MTKPTIDLAELRNDGLVAGNESDAVYAWIEAALPELEDYLECYEGVTEKSGDYPRVLRLRALIAQVKRGEP